MTEATFQSEVLRFLRRNNNVGILKPKYLANITEFNDNWCYHPPDNDRLNKPCDIVGGFIDRYGTFRPFSLELKLAKSKRFQFCRIEESQHAHLALVSVLYPDNTWAALLINFRYDTPGKKINKAYRIPYYVIKEMVKAGVKGMDISDAEKLGIECAITKVNKKIAWKLW